MLMTGTVATRPAELIAFEQPGCPYCLAFEREVGVSYALTDEGRRIPLRRVDLAGPTPGDLAFIRVERFAPVFVLVDGQQEIGRIRGYAGVEQFWAQYGTLTKRIHDRGGQREPAAAAHP